MKTLFLLMMSGLISLAEPLVAWAQTNEPAALTSSQASALKKTLSEKPFLGTKSVLTLSGDYVNTPKEDYEMKGIWNTPLTLEEMHGMVAEIGFRDATKKGEWQFRFKRKLATMDTSWRATTDAARNIGLSDRRSQVLKASYNVKDWWQVGVSALVEDKVGFNTSLDLVPIGLRNGQALGFQIDTLFKF